MTRVALLWHMHQPFYQDLRTGEHVMPWVRLHALKDYWGMVALLREFPAVRLTFNLVPSMLVQLEAYARNGAQDRHLALGLKPADALSPAERAYCVEEFFHAHPARMIHPHARYAELLALRGEARHRRGHDVGSGFSPQDLRDLQVWHKLVWIDPLYHEHDARVRALVAKHRDFDETDKAALREVELELLRRVIPEYREAAARGQVELSTSPFYHPILPLLCDTDIYRRTHPDSRLPREPFRHPEDARLQIDRAIACHERLFGHSPAGLWPSEGSVSDDMIRVVAETGIRWIATDEAILARSIDSAFSRDPDGTVHEAERLYRAYSVGPGPGHVTCAFRDHALSDAIGFTYASWDPEVAAENFVRRIRDAGRAFTRRAPAGEEPTVFIILDGENAWEHYHEQGRPFLRALYRRLSESPDLRTVTMHEACAGATTRLPTIFPGSWIDSNFYIWIGHRDDQRAWSQLVDARRAVDTAPASVSAEARALAREELLVAEGSDWFWWYGDDHSSDHDAVFDELFRRHVRNVYEALGRAAPDELLATNISTTAVPADPHPPTAVLALELDGEESSYFEWLGAGTVDVSPAESTMHQTASREDTLTRITFAFDAAGNLLLRADASGPLAELLAPPAAELVVRFLEPSGTAVRVRPAALAVATLATRIDSTWAFEPHVGLTGAVGTIAEVVIPRALLTSETRRVRFVVELRLDERQHQILPKNRPIELALPA
jgi:alpha-amylase/alpha-mannosidase (GH57 family)